MEPLESSPLFVAATRPALVAGMPIGLAVAFMMAFALIMIFGEDPLYELVLVPVWFGARLIVRYDYNGVRIVALWLQTSARSIDAHRWGGASPAPFPVRQARHPRGICDAR
jgi:type IV secretion system protein VirB3